MSSPKRSPKKTSAQIGTDFNLADHLFPKRKLSDYRQFVSEKTLAAIKKEASQLEGKTVFRLNATPFGGGVAEMVPFFCALLRDLGIKAHWLTMASPQKEKAGYNPPADFFGMTSGLHYHLQDAQEKWLAYEQKGDKIKPRPISGQDKEGYYEVNRRFGELIKQAEKALSPADVVINDDPQCAAAIETARSKNQTWIWRFHPYGDPESAGWDFLAPFIKDHQAMVATMPEYLPFGLRQEITLDQNFPFVDPFHEKVEELSAAKANRILAEFGLDPEKPILAQSSRFDPDKDPLGVIEVFRILKEQYPDLQMIYTGPFAFDNPTSVIILEQMQEKIAEYGFEENKDVFFLHSQTKSPRPFSYPELAAMWHAPNVHIVQLSTKEGFGMVVAEAAWCGKPVVGTRVGGIVPQILDGKTGFLVEPYDHEAVAVKVGRLINNPELAQKMGVAAHRHIQENFLITANLGRWLKLMNQLRK